MNPAPERVIRLEGAHNVRDLGGYPVGGGASTRWRAIFRGDNLSALTEADANTLIDLGVRTIIDLRGDGELTAQPNPFASATTLHYVNIPLYDEMEPITAVNGTLDMGARYITALERCRPRIAEVLTAIASADTGAVLFHCTAGKDRTGIIAALLLSICGVPRKTVIDDYALTGRAEPMLSRLRYAALARGAAPEHVDRMLGSAPATMDAMLAHIENEHRGIAHYLARIGLDRSIIEGIALRLVC